MKRPLGEKLQSTKLQQSWYILIAATVMRILDLIPADVWLGACGISQGIYAYANYKQHQLYAQPQPDPGVGVDDP